MTFLTRTARARKAPRMTTNQPLALASEYLSIPDVGLTDDQHRSRTFALATWTDETGGDTAVFGARVSHWIERVVEIEEFIAEYGRMPRENNRATRATITPHERALHEFVRYQRRPVTRATHCEFQTRRLEQLPGWSWGPHEDAWQAQFDSYRAFIDDNGGAPRWRSLDGNESTHAAWAARQRRENRKGTLPAHRRAALARLRIWAW